MSRTRYTVDPFPGIRNFESDEDHLFFGRDRTIADVTQLLSSTRFLALIGYSGSGKSSLIKAGIIPAVVRGSDADQEKWATIYFRPDGDPFRSFAEALMNNSEVDAYHDDDDHVNILARYLKNDAPDLQKVHERFSTARQPNWLIVIDQFEEVFRFRDAGLESDDHHDTQRFIDLILSGVRSAGLPVYVMVSMRSDFLDNCTQFNGLSQAINKGSYLLPRVTTEGIYDIITKPVAVCHGHITDGLVQRLMADLSTDLDQLPVLQHAMMRTWDHWKQHSATDSELSIAHYEAVGTMSSALSIHAEEIYTGLSERKQRIAEKIFKALTDVTVSNKGTRRPAQLWELIELSGATEQEVVDVIDEFRAPGRAFLMPVYTVGLEEDTVIDIAHESIMRIWTRLRDWVLAEERSAELYLRLSKAADLYQQGKGGIWVDPDLAQAVKWQQDEQPTAAWAQRYDPAFERAMAFLTYSKKENAFKLEQRAQKQANELRRARRTAIILGTASVFALLLLVLALNLKFKAEASEKRALDNEKQMKVEGAEADLQRKQAVLQQKIAEQQQSIASQQQSLAEEQKLTAISERHNAELQKSLAIAQGREAEVQRQKAVYQKRQADTARVAALDSGKVAARQRDNAIVARREVETLRMLTEARSIAFKSTQLAGDAQKDTLSVQMAFLSYVINREYGGTGLNRAIYDALKAQLNRYYNKVLRYTYGVKTDAGGYDLRNAVFTANNEFFTAGDDGIVKQWGITNTPVQIRLKKATRSVGEGITSINLSADKKLLLGRTLNGRVMIWNVADLTLLPSILPDAAIKAQYVNFIPASSGYRLVVKSDKFAGIYNYNAGAYKLVNRYQLCRSSFDNASQSGCTQVIGDKVNIYLAQGNSVCLLTLNDDADLVAINTVITLRDKVSSMTLSNNDKLLAIGTDGGNTELYDITGSRPTLDSRFNSHSSRVTGITFNRDQSTLITGSLDNTVRLSKWQSSKEDKGEDLIFQERKSWVRNIAVSPNYRYVLSVGQRGILQLWPATERVALQELTDITADRKLITGDVKEHDIEKEIGADIYKKLWAGKYKSFDDFWTAMVTKYITKAS
ncbi:hypothetical protein LLH06_09010 [Mucilaginibacter daejeonensis]|uniref:nSTAND1 domain-containing NTPase n=1 Tax=Mucilaginibacter daejeonensis TaxID=398049 RepID=UPI001D17D35F|nr:hypothetical protein [Mucilaginibacter daejeonensis]UEG55100.1 hypothetical protein LLH06_09010 [Mucilaginibacter daejeonensis]